MSTQCKDCTDRYVGCHSKCEKYLEFREKLDKQNELRNDIKNKQRVIANYSYERSRRLK